MNDQNSSNNSQPDLDSLLSNNPQAPTPLPAETTPGPPSNSFNGGTNSSFSGSYSGVPPTPQPFNLASQPDQTPAETPFNPPTPPITPTASNGGESGFNWAPSAPTSSNPPAPDSTSTDFTPADLSNIHQPTAPTGPTVLPSQPQATPELTTPLGTVTPIMVTENTPTDLSHLIQPNIPTPTPTQPAYNPAMTQSTESLVVPTEVNTDSVPTTSISTAKDGIPKWVIILGVVLLLAVASASAYFILGIGRNNQPPASAPATSEEQSITPPATIAPTPIATTSSQPVSTGSAGFNNLNNQATSSGTSALDQLRQRQGQ